MPGASSLPTFSAFGGEPSATMIATPSRPSATTPVSW
jgi:hypothetical protein